jgi:hypothetical protein
MSRPARHRYDKPSVFVIVPAPVLSARQKHELEIELRSPI